MLTALEENTARIASDLPVHTRVYHSDFIEHAALMILQRQRFFTHAILIRLIRKLTATPNTASFCGMSALKR
jgi:hypothetical protein